MTDCLKRYFILLSSCIYDIQLAFVVTSTLYCCWQRTRH